MVLIKNVVETGFFSVKKLWGRRPNKKKGSGKDRQRSVCVCVQGGGARGRGRGGGKVVVCGGRGGAALRRGRETKAKGGLKKKGSKRWWRSFSPPASPIKEGAGGGGVMDLTARGREKRARSQKPGGNREHRATRGPRWPVRPAKVNNGGSRVIREDHDDGRGGGGKTRWVKRKEGVRALFDWIDCRPRHLPLSLPFPLTVAHWLHAAACTVCSPVISRRSSLGPCVTLTTELNR